MFRIKKESNLYKYSLKDRNLQLSKNFYLHEFIDSCFFLPAELDMFQDIYISNEMVDVLQYLRNEFEKSIYINCFARSVAHEKSKKRSGNSKHVEFIAIDISGKFFVEWFKIQFYNKTNVYEYLRSMGVNGIGFYKTFIHLDFRGHVGSNLVSWGLPKKKKTLDYFCFFPF